AVGNARALGLQAEDGLAHHGLAGAALAHQSQHRAGGKLEADAAQDRREAGAARQLQVHILDLQQRAHRRSTGSRLSRNPSPSALNPSTVTMMHSIGSAIIHQAWLM